MTATERAKKVAWSLIDQPATDGNSAVAELFDRDKAERIIANVIWDAVVAERERCVKIAERFIKDAADNLDDTLWIAAVLTAIRSGN